MNKQVLRAPKINSFTGMSCDNAPRIALQRSPTSTSLGKLCIIRGINQRIKACNLRAKRVNWHAHGTLATTIPHSPDFGLSNYAGFLREIRFYRDSNRDNLDF